jgi:glycosyltransferase involved in cell wall biosynthesis
MKTQSNSPILISVIIPTYNYAIYLNRVLNSVIEQLTDSTEIIVVDDGSTDETNRILLSYKEEYPNNFYILSQSNKGAAAARNNGIRHARGQYVLMLDADDELTPNALRTMYDLIKLHPNCSMVNGAHWTVDQNNKRKLKLPTRLDKDLVRRLKGYLIDKTVTLSHSCNLFRKNLLLESLYPERFRSREDIPVFAFLLSQPDIVQTNIPMAVIYKHSDSLRHRVVEDCKEALDLADEVFSRIPHKCITLKKRYEAQRYLSLFRTAIMDNRFDLAIFLYLKALKLSFIQSLKPTYLRKFIAAQFKTKFSKT